MTGGFLICVFLSVHRFSVGILPGTKLESGPATLHLCNNLLALTRDIPPVIIGHWNLPDLRRYGPVPNGFVFEGGTRCGFCKFITVRARNPFCLERLFLETVSLLLISLVTVTNTLSLLSSHDSKNRVASLLPNSSLSL